VPGRRCRGSGQLTPATKGPQPRGPPAGASFLWLGAGVSPALLLRTAQPPSSTILPIDLDRARDTRRARRPPPPKTPGREAVLPQPKLLDGAEASPATIKAPSHEIAPPQPALFGRGGRLARPSSPHSPTAIVCHPCPSTSIAHATHGGRDARRHQRHQAVKPCYPNQNSWMVQTPRPPPSKAPSHEVAPPQPALFGRGGRLARPSSTSQPPATPIQPHPPASVLPLRHHLLGSTTPPRRARRPPPPKRSVCDAGPVRLRFPLGRKFNVSNARTLDKVWYST